QLLHRSPAEAVPGQERTRFAPVSPSRTVASPGEGGRFAALAQNALVVSVRTEGALCAQIDRQQFEETVRTLNNLYAEAEKLGGQSYLEGCLACLTAYTIFLCMETHYEKVLKKIAKFIQEQNEKIYAPQGLLLTDPIERGLRVIEITIYEDRGLTSGR
uniref:Golgin subfamily A member 7 n=1 Tax=Ficedula albicollis TaxID=59894 RepID=A0A803VR54_FICAL